MKVFVVVIALSVLRAAASDLIDLKGKITTFTNLQGQTFQSVSLIHGDLDGVIWRKDASGGRVCYTNLNPVFLEDWSIPTNRIAVALERAERAAVAWARTRAAVLQQAAAEAQQKAKEKSDWEAAGPARELEAQRQKDLAKIETLRDQIKEYERKVKYADATTPTSAVGTPEYVSAIMALRAQVNAAALKLQEAKAELGHLESAYDKKYRPEEKN